MLHKPACLNDVCKGEGLKMSILSLGYCELLCACVD